tara:strand:+ start:641 stop:1564 length:924 start_codon:yes stop_codon:yes gene_type:complete
MMKQLWISLLFIALSGVLKAQPFSFRAEADTNFILIGEQFTVTLTADLDEATSYSWPAFPDSTEGLELVEASSVDTLEKGGRWILEQQLTITSFDSGYFAVPPLTLVVQGQAANTEAIGIAVRFPDLSQREDIYDIKKPLEVPLNWWLIALYVLSGLAVILLLVWLWYHNRKKGKAQPTAPELQIPPHKYALMQLAELEREELWQKGELKAYYSRLVDILRIYLERQMSIQAMESTAEEIIGDLEDQNLPKDLFEELKHTLRLSAMVKFAKEKPGPGENEEALKTVRHFIEHTHIGKESQNVKADVE